MFGSQRRPGILSELPAFARWFIYFVIAGAISVFGVVIFIAYMTISTLTNPEAIGSYVGKIQSGYENAVGK